MKNNKEEQLVNQIITCIFPKMLGKRYSEKKYDYYKSLISRRFKENPGDKTRFKKVLTILQHLKETQPSYSEIYRNLYNYFFEPSREYNLSLRQLGLSPRQLGISPRQLAPEQHKYKLANYDPEYWLKKWKGKYYPKTWHQKA